MSWRIKMIKFYQAVLLEGQGGAISSFTPDDLISDAAQRKGLTVEETEHGIMLYSKVARTLVTWNNVAYVQYLPVQDSKPAKAEKSK